MPLFADAAADVPDKDRQESRPAPHRAGTPGGVTRLQAYVAQPDPVEPRPKPELYGAPPGTSLEALREAYAHPQVLPEGWAQYASQSGATTEQAHVSGTAAPEEPPSDPERYRARTTKEMSWDKYLELSDRERAAIDFNTLLIQARQKDLKHQDDYKPSDVQKDVYDRTVQRIFGEDGVSQTYAPETVALLNDIGFKGSDAKRFDDLDDFLGLRSAITSKDLDKMASNKDMLAQQFASDTIEKLGAPVNVSAPEPNTASSTTGALAAGTRDLTDSLTRGHQVLENFRRVMAGDRAESVSYYGGIAPGRFAAPQIRLNAEDEKYFPLAFEALADAANDPSVLQAIKTDLKGDRMKRFLEYADTRSAYSMEHRQGLGTNGGVQYRSPEEFRQILGLEGGGSDASAAR